MLSLATSHIVHLCNQLNHVAQPIFMPRFKSSIFYLNSSKIKLFLQKNAKFRALGARSPDPRASGGWGLCPHTPIGLWQLGALPPDPQNSPPHCEFLAARLIPIHKKGDTNKIPTTTQFRYSRKFDKIFEKIIYNRL